MQNNKTIRVAINGAGRIGRAFLKLSLTRPELEVVALNDLGDIENLAYLLRYDSAYGRSGLDVKVNEDKKGLKINGRDVAYVSVKEPALLPWNDLNIDIVVESTGFFTSYEGAEGHLNAGAKRVVISAPTKDKGEKKAAMILMGINEQDFEKSPITSNASCTTNSASPVLAILDEAIGVEKAVLNTVHGYTASQSLVDGPNKKDWKEGRAAAQNIVPTTTGAAIAVAKVLPQFENLFDGISMRVPVIAGSIADVTFIAKRNTTVEEVNEVLSKGAGEERWKKVFAVTTDPLVSRDIVGELHASIADLNFTKVIGGNLVKVCAWYDNEMGYTSSLVEHVITAGKYIK
jgi:glyceraldehyde 3-phosphate dehydrogenase